MIFRQFQPGVAYKSVAYKKRVIPIQTLISSSSFIKIPMPMISIAGIFLFQGSILQA